jgi:hypothetical protein
MALPPINDNVCNAMAITSVRCFTADYTFATPQPEEPISSAFVDIAGVTNSLWYTITGVTSLDLEEVSVTDSQSAIYRADDGCGNFGAFVEIASNDDVNEIGGDFRTHLIVDSLDPAETYYIQIDPWGGPGSLADFRISGDGLALPFEIQINGTEAEECLAVYYEQTIELSAELILPPCFVDVGEVRWTTSDGRGAVGDLADSFEINPEETTQVRATIDTEIGLLVDTLTIIPDLCYHENTEYTCFVF